MTEQFFPKFNLVSCDMIFKHKHWLFSNKQIKQPKNEQRTQSKQNKFKNLDGEICIKILKDRPSILLLFSTK